MWLVVIREPRPDATVWPGRRWVAAADAVAWPCLWIYMVHRLALSPGLPGAAFEVVVAFWAMQRFWRALLVSHRYRFTTWRWGKAALALLVAGEALRFALLA